MVSQRNRAGTTARLTGLAALGSLLGAVAPTASADDSAFFVTYFNNGIVQGGGTFGTIDLNTGVVSPSASQSPPCCSHTYSSGVGFVGIGVTNGTLYAATAPVTPGESFTPPVANGVNPPVQTSEIINFHSGHSTSFVGDTNHNAADFGSTTTGGLYLIGQGGGVQSISSTDAAPTPVGLLTLGLGGPALSAYGAGVNSSGVSTGSSSLFLAINSTLYTVNTTPGPGGGAATQLGSTTDGNRLYDITAMVYENGTLYGYAYDANWASNNDYNSYVVELNQTTGAVIGDQTITGPAGYDASIDNVIVGLADVSSVTSVPEPATLGLLGLGIAGLSFTRKRKSS